MTEKCESFLHFFLWHFLQHTNTITVLVASTRSGMPGLQHERQARAATLARGMHLILGREHQKLLNLQLTCAAQHAFINRKQQRRQRHKAQADSAAELVLRGVAVEASRSAAPEASASYSLMTSLISSTVIPRPAVNSLIRVSRAGRVTLPRGRPDRQRGSSRRGGSS